MSATSATFVVRREGVSYDVTVHGTVTADGVEHFSVQLIVEHDEGGTLRAFDLTDAERTEACRHLHEAADANVDMTDTEVVAHLRAWAKNPRRELTRFAWATDACGYDQHVRFVNHKNAHWEGGTVEEFDAFILAYAAQLEAGAT